MHITFKGKIKMAIDLWEIDESLKTVDISVEKTRNEYLENCSLNMKVNKIIFKQIQTWKICQQNS